MRRPIRAYDLLFGVSVMLFAGCQSVRTEPDFGGGMLGDQRLVPKAGRVDAIVETDVVIAPETVSNALTHDDDPDDIDEIAETIAEGIPVELNDNVEKWLAYFSGNGRERFERFMARGEIYRPMILKVLKDRGVPPELFYLAMIESGFSVHAHSHASAVGIWQFIKATGLRYGMRIDGYVDERKDPVRATIAASLYLRDLHNVFQDWYLAMAAYNAGEMRILSAIMKHNTRDFWELVRLDALPKETMNYVPKFLAATIIGKNPEKYGFAQPTGEAWPALAAVAVPSPVRLSTIAAQTGVSIAAIQTYNPHIKQGVTPPGVTDYRIWVESNQVAQVTEKTASLQAERVTGLKVQVADNEHFHRVKRGETLALIAARYGTSVSSLKKLNGIRSDRIQAGARLKVSGTRVGQTAQKAVTKYRVQKGDSLAAIAKKFGVSIETLKSMNQLKRTTIYAGQILRVGTSRM